MENVLLHFVGFTHISFIIWNMRRNGLESRLPNKDRGSGTSRWTARNRSVTTGTRTTLAGYNRSCVKNVVSTTFPQHAAGVPVMSRVREWIEAKYDNEYVFIGALVTFSALSIGGIIFLACCA